MHFRLLASGFRASCVGREESGAAEGYDEDHLHDSEADPSDEHEDATSAEDGLAASHDGELAKSDKD